MSAPPIQVGQPLPGAILFVTVQRDKNGSYTPMIAYDPWAKGGDTIPTLKKRWGSNGPYRERLDKNVVWAGSPRGERYVGVLGQNKSDTSPKWPYLSDSRVGQGVLMALNVLPRPSGTRAVPMSGSTATTDFIFDPAGVAKTDIGNGSTTPVIPLYDGSQYSFDNLGYYTFSIDFYAMANGSLNLTNPRL